MDVQLVIILALTFVIHFIGTSAYAFRIAAVRTGQIAVAFSLFNILVLVSRTSNSFQAPFVAKRVENALSDPGAAVLLSDFRLILISATVATIVAALMVPTLQRLATTAVVSFKQRRSVLRLVWGGLGRSGIGAIRSSMARPDLSVIRQLRPGRDLPYHFILLNIVATALWTVGVLASIYAGHLLPEFRVTASSLSAIINGVATIFLFVVLDPYIAAATDEAAREAEQRQPREAAFRRMIVWMVLSRAAGTLLAQLLLVPSAKLIAVVAAMI